MQRRDFNETIFPYAGASLVEISQGYERMKLQIGQDGKGETAYLTDAQARQLIDAITNYLKAGA